jgi:hypothetical protein
MLRRYREMRIPVPAKDENPRGPRGRGMVRIRLIELIGIYRLHDFLQSFPSFSSFPIAVSLNSTNPSIRKEEYQQIGEVPIPFSPWMVRDLVQSLREQEIPRGITFPGEA